MRFTHMTGQNRTGSDKTGYVTHAVENLQSLCGKNPTGRGSWSEYDDKELTCPRCKLALERAELVDQNGQHGTLKPGVAREQIKSIDAKIQAVNTASRERYAYQSESIADTINRMIERGYNRLEKQKRGVRLYREDGEYYPIFDKTGMDYIKAIL